MNERSITVLLTVTVLLFLGCSKKEDGPAAPAASALSELIPVENPPKSSNLDSGSHQEVSVTFDEVLVLWSSGQQVPAAERFSKIQWNRPDIFASDSVFRISEDQFVEFSAARQEQIDQQAIELANHIRALTKYIVEQAKQQGQYETIRNNLIACGQRLSKTDQLLLIQMVGEVAVTYTEKELPVR